MNINSFNYQPENMVEIQSGCHFTAGAEVLLVQDVVSWAAAPDQNPLGADATELDVQQLNFDLVPSSMIGVTALNKYKMIIIAAAQPQSFYYNLFPDGQIHLALVLWTERGGILNAHLADRYSSNWNDRVFLGGVQKVYELSQNNGIVTPKNPLITGEFGYINGGRIKDIAPFKDLDDWNYSSHGYFTNLAPGTRIILADDLGGAPDKQKPVMIEYRFGYGTVIASMTTTEWRYVGGYTGSLPQNKKLLANEIGYQLHLAHYFN